MSRQRSPWIAIAAVGAVIIGATVATYFINPFNTASEEPSARLVGYTPYRVPGVSMEPTLRAGKSFIVKTAALRNRDPAVGEIVVFQYPPNPRIHFVSRVVAVGGTTLELRKGELFIDGDHVAQPWLPAEPIRTFEVDGAVMPLREADIFPDLAPLAIPNDHFFVMGDNRGNAEDSRVWGFVPRANMIGIHSAD